MAIRKNENMKIVIDGYPEEYSSIDEALKAKKEKKEKEEKEKKEKKEK